MKTLYAYIFILAMGATFSCASKKVAHKDYHATDSLKHNVHLTVSSATVPESRATLTIATNDLHQLPPNAAFTQHNGQATAILRYMRDTLFVEASCDSLQRLVYEYSSELTHLQQQRKAECLKNETKQSPLKAVIPLLIITALLIGTAYVVIRLRIFPKA